MSVYEAARTDIATIVDRIIAAWTPYTLVVEMDNREIVDQTLQVNPYLMVSTKWLSGKQKDMSGTPIVGQYGQILLAAAVKQGDGSTMANQLLDFCIPYFEFRTMPSIVIKEFQPTAPVKNNGWYYPTALLNFYLNRVSAQN